MEKIDQLRYLVKIQSASAGTDYYHHGLANGLILALALFEGKEPKFIEVSKNQPQTPRMVLTKQQMAALGIRPPDCIESQPLPADTNPTELEPT